MRNGSIVRRAVFALAILAPVLGGAMAAPAGAASTISVTPSTNLADGQVVHVSVSGFGTGVGVGMAQCVDSFDYYANCSGFLYGGQVSATGTLELDVQVTPILQTQSLGQVDCRVPPAGHTCIIGVNTQPTVDGAAITPVTFDASAPLQPAPPITASPDTGLHDQDVVYVVGTGFTQYNPPTVMQCVAGATTSDGCATDYTNGFVILGPNAAGEFVAALRVRSAISTRFGNVVCASSPGACELQAVQYRQSGELRSSTPLSFAAGGPTPSLPTLTATPNTGLVDEQVVRVTGSGFQVPPDYYYGCIDYCGLPIQGAAPAELKQPQKSVAPYGSLVMMQCTTTEPLVCSNLGYSDVATDGTVDVEVPLRASLWDPSSSVSYDCRPAAGRCQLVALTEYQPNNVGFAALTFNPAAPLSPAPTLAATPHAGLVDHQVVDLSGSGYDLASFGYGPYYPIYYGVPLRENPVTKSRTPDLAAMRATAEQATKDAAQGRAATNGPAGLNTPMPADVIVPPPFSTIVQVMQCATATPGYNGCDQTTYGTATVDDAGNLTGRVQVHAQLTLFSNGIGPATTVDCRTVACELRTQGDGDPQHTGVAPLTFTADGPLAPPPSLTVTPSTDLKDGQLVHVHGENFSWNGAFSSSMYLQQCVAGDPTACQPVQSNGIYVEGSGVVHEDGTFDMDVIVSAELVAYLSPSYTPSLVDCRVQACTITAPVYSYTTAAPPSAPLDFNPNAPLKGWPTAAANVGADLPSPADIKVVFSGFTAGTNVRVVQCLDTGLLTSLTCDESNVVTVPTGNLGEGVVPFTAQRYITLRDGTTVDCAIEWCPVMVFDNEMWGQQAAAYVWFSDTPPVNPTTPTTTPTTTYVAPLVNPRFTG